MNARDKYAEVHSDVMSDLYDLFIEDTALWDKVVKNMGKIATAAFDFGSEAARKSGPWEPTNIHQVY